MASGEATGSDTDALTRLCGAIGMAGSVIVVAADLLGARLSDHLSLIADTISNLAAGGRLDWLEDAGLYAFVIGIAAVAAGLARWRDGDWRWPAGQALLVALAVDVTAIAAYEAYNSPDGRPDLHYYFVYSLGIAFPLAVWLTSHRLGAESRRLRLGLRIYAVVWGLAGPGLFLAPTAWDGLYERTLAIAMVGWFLLAGYLLWRGGGRQPESAAA